MHAQCDITRPERECAANIDGTRVETKKYMLSRKEKDKHRMVILTCGTLKKNTGLIK